MEAVRPRFRLRAAKTRETLPSVQWELFPAAFGSGKTELEQDADWPPSGSRPGMDAGQTTAFLGPVGRASISIGFPVSIRYT